ncbi:hypothetical protein C5688_02125 [Methylocystis sp. MitZ-2018]|nr:hypothetical protein C5688_02125 [Methylocystis sp. MitZ-2018]
MRLSVDYAAAVPRNGRLHYFPLPLAGEGGPAKRGRVRVFPAPSSVAHSRDTFSRKREKVETQ